MKSKIVLVFGLMIAGFIGMSFTLSNEHIRFESVSKEMPSEDLKWHTNFAEAMALSNSNNKPIFAFFTGSDWCGWCKKLQREVFYKEAFKTWANENVILLELDFPRRTKLDPTLAQQNASLAQALKIRGYPTVWLLNAEQNAETKNINLNTLGALGYPSGAVKGKEEVLFIKNANQILAKGKKS